MDWMGWLLVGVAALALARWLARPHTVVRFADGRARVVRGRLPPVLLNDLLDLAAAAPTARGTLTLTGRGGSLVVRVQGLDASLEQRVRNVVGFHRSRLASLTA